MKLTQALRRLRFNTVDGIFQPLVIHASKDGFAKDDKFSCRSQKLMVSQGIIHQSHNGLFCLLPLGLRVVEKLMKIVDRHMEKLGAQKIIVPSLTDGNLWKKTGRLETAGNEIFRVLDRHQKMFVLAPTHEESLANLLATIPAISHRNLPLRLYQITNKYRDEMRPRYGLIRSKEFMMKDLYSFDTDIEMANKTYEHVCEIYGQLLDHIGIRYSRGRKPLLFCLQYETALPMMDHLLEEGGIDAEFEIVSAPSGMMGGERSHEFHYLSDIGDDTLLTCEDCGHSWNREIDPELDACQQCSSTRLNQTKGIEVANTFLLGTKYSTALSAHYVGAKSQKPVDFVMGSYGIGITRLLAASLEVLSSSGGLRWPQPLSPFTVLIITPKAARKPEQQAQVMMNEHQANLDIRLMSFGHQSNKININNNMPYTMIPLLVNQLVERKLSNARLKHQFLFDKPIDKATGSEQKEGSKVSLRLKNTGQELYVTLNSMKHLENEVLWDNRDHLSIGRRLNDAKLTGYPIIIVIGKLYLEQPPKYEVHCVYDNSVHELEMCELQQFVSQQKYLSVS